MYLVYLFFQVQNLSGGELQRVALTICLGKVGTCSSSVVWEIPANEVSAAEWSDFFLGMLFPFFHSLTSFNNKRLLHQPLDSSYSFYLSSSCEIHDSLLCSVIFFSLSCTCLIKKK